MPTLISKVYGHGGLHETEQLSAYLIYLCFTFLHQEAKAYAEENDLLFLETSAKADMNVEELFRAIGMTDIKIKQCVYFRSGL